MEEEDVGAVDEGRGAGACAEGTGAGDDAVVETGVGHGTVTGIKGDLWNGR